MTSPQREHTHARTFAALVGSMPPAFALGIAVVLAMPAPLPTRYAVASCCVFPGWAAITCLLFLARDATRAWLAAVATTLALLAVGALAVLGGWAPSPWASLR